MQRVGIEESHESNNTIRDRGHCVGAVFEGSFKDAAATRDAKTKRVSNFVLFIMRIKS